MSQNKQSGNVLFLILIAVVLFAALSYAVTSSSGTGGNKETSDEKNQLYASEIKQYASAVRVAITRLTASSRCTIEELSFEGPPFDDSDVDYVNPNSPSDLSCHIFHPQGGGVSWSAPDEKWLKGTTLAKWGNQFVFTGNDCIGNVGTGAGAGCYNNGTNSDTELLLYLIDVTDSLCLTLMGDGSTSIPNMPGGNFFSRTEAVGKFKGTFGYNATDSGNSHTIYDKYSYCFFHNISGVNHYYDVLVAR